ncbi:MAG: hypothetical protein H6982_16260 [Chromatiales bacterium]|nr:hypothetical protein [Chromatiales bacterium]
MIDRRLSPTRRAGARHLLAFLAGLLAGTTSTLAPAASSIGGADHLLVLVGSGNGTGNGDYVSSRGGLDTAYRFFLEVPPNAFSTSNRLRIQLFDPEIRSTHDLASGSTAVRYTVLGPNGELVVGPITLLSGQLGGLNDLWADITLPNGASPPPGHWEVRIDMSSAVSDGFAVHGLGLRAHDGDPGAGGVEIPVYAASYLPPGTVTNFGAVTQRYHPFVTAGCDASSVDFDFDVSVPNSVSTVTPRTRLGIGPSRSSPTASGNGDFNVDVLGAWTTPTSAVDYGIWDVDYRLVPTPGGSGNNWTTTYFTTGTASTPPSAQPEPGAFRIYLPADDGGPPRKPEIGQQIVDVEGGPAVPTVGQTTTVRVAVAVRNPTARPIAFDAGNLVRVRVPGGKATFGGGVIAFNDGTDISATSILAAPAVGSGGDLEWNPGPIAAGAIAQLSYLVAVTPTIAGETVAVTGSPGAAGTTATYVDETCAGASPACSGLALSNATYVYGPLCGLSLTVEQSLTTRARIGAFGAESDGDGARLHWTTLSEHGTVGFRVLRRASPEDAYEPVAPGLVPGLLHAPGGGHYWLRDPLGDPLARTEYVLEELEASGRIVRHGPYRVRPRHGATAADVGRGLARDQGAVPRATPPRPRAAEASPSGPLLAPVAASAAAPAARLLIGVERTGLHRLSAESLAAAAGAEAAAVRDAIAHGRLALSRAGKPVPTLPGSGGEALYFHGVAPSDGRARESVYVLESGVATLMEIRLAGQPEPVAPGTFLATSRAEGNRYALTHLADDPDDDYWMWDFRIAGVELPPCGPLDVGGSCYLPFVAVEAPDVDPAGGPAYLLVRLQGGNDVPGAGDHRVTVWLDDAPLGEVVLDGTTARTALFTLDPARLRDGENRVTISVPPPADPALPGVVYLNDVELRYPRRRVLHDGRLELAAGGSAAVTVDGLGSPLGLLLETSDPHRPAFLVGARVDPSDAGYALTFRATPEGAAYSVTDPGAILAPSRIVPVAATDLADLGHAVDYLVITAPALRPAAERLAAHRASGGLRSLVVDTDEIAAAFGDGVGGPRAIAALVRHAVTRWLVAPRAVVLAGNTSVDYRGDLGPPPLLPGFLVATPDGLFPSDDPIADARDGDGLPDVAVGRLPAANLAELDAMVDKILAHEASAAGAPPSAVLAADRTGPAGDFTANSEALAALFPATYRVDRIHADVPIPEPHVLACATHRECFLAALREGRGYANFVGHAGTTSLGDANLLTLDDLPTLGNLGALPVVVAQTCLAGQHALPGLTGLGEGLVLEPGGGAIAVLAPSGLSVDPLAHRLASAFYRARFPTEPGVAPVTTVGEAVLAAKREAAADGVPTWLTSIHVLLGDPLIRLP